MQQVNTHASFYKHELIIWYDIYQGNVLFQCIVTDCQPHQVQRTHSTLLQLCNPLQQHLSLAISFCLLLLRCGPWSFWLLLQQLTPHCYWPSLLLPMSKGLVELFGKVLQQLVVVHCNLSGCLWPPDLKCACSFLLLVLLQQVPDDALRDSARHNQRKTLAWCMLSAHAWQTFNK